MSGANGSLALNAGNRGSILYRSDLCQNSLDRARFEAGGSPPQSRAGFSGGRREAALAPVTRRPCRSGDRKLGREGVDPDSGGVDPGLRGHQGKKKRGPWLHTDVDTSRPRPAAFSQEKSFGSERLISQFARRVNAEVVGILVPGDSPVGQPRANRIPEPTLRVPFLNISAPRGRSRLTRR